jgi:predicted anti-sigma-YlaC factor YlaD
MPSTKALLRALKDNKRGDRWLNSWVAMVAIGLTLFFGLVQSIEGAVQVYKAYHPAAG